LNKLQILADDNYTAVYKEGVKVFEDDSYGHENLLRVLGYEVEIIYPEDFSEEEYTYNDNGDSFYKGKMIWCNDGSGFVKEWPFED